MKWYYDFEQEKYISKEQLYSEFMRLKTEQPENYDYSFLHFVSNCLASNNGSLYTLSQWINKLEKDYFIAKLDEYDLGLDSDSESEQIMQEIEKAKKYQSEV